MSDSSDSLHFKPVRMARPEETRTFIEAKRLRVCNLDIPVQFELSAEHTDKVPVYIGSVVYRFEDRTAIARCRRGLRDSDRRVLCGTAIDALVAGPDFQNRDWSDPERRDGDLESFVLMWTLWPIDLVAEALAAEAASLPRAEVGELSSSGGSSRARSHHLLDPR